MTNPNNITLDQQNALLALTKEVAIYSDFNSKFDAVKLLTNGLIFIDESGNPLRAVPSSIARKAIELYGYNNESFNNTLIDSFAKVANMTPLEFYTIQILHYLTTYGTNFTTPFIVGARTFTPEETKALKITIIRAVPGERALDKINDLFANTGAPKQQNMVHYRALAPLTTIAPDTVKSKELMILVCEMRGIKPTEPEALLRYLIYCATGETLLIKNHNLYEKICNSSYMLDLSDNEERALATIFYRYKPLLLAFKWSALENRVSINRIRRLATKLHKPQSARNLKNFIAFALNDDLKETDNLIAKATNKELIKLYNAVAATTASKKVYQIRNGKMFAAVCNNTLTKNQRLRLHCAKLAIETELRTRFASYRGQVIYIPAGIDYAVPYSEKQMTGAIPWGTVITTRSHDALTVGIHWVNDENESSCDLDLHTFTPTQHIGWNGSYKTNKGEILYSGDMTNAPAPLGAAESFYVSNISEPIIFNVNAYNATENKRFQFFVTKGKDCKMRSRCTFDSKKLVTAPIPLSFAGYNAMTLGVMKDNQFYIYGGDLGKRAIPSNYYANFIDGLIEKCGNALKMREFADIIGMKVVTSAPTGTPFINLAPEALTVNTLLDFVGGNIEKL